MVRYLIIIISLFTMLISFSADAKEKMRLFNFGMTSQKRLERFFDIDKNGWLSLYERNLIATHKRFGWPLANTKKKREFDFNSDYMLGPFEYETYLKSKKNRKARYRKVPIRQ